MTGASRCVGALMAGGGARRFGQLPKGLARVDGARIADRALAALRSACDQQLIVANDPRAASWFPGETIVPDDRPGAGPLVGLLAALRAAKGAPLLVVAWDMPFVSGALLALLREIGERGASAVAPLGGPLARPEPLCAYYGEGALSTCERLVDAGERRAGALFDAMPGARTVDVAELAPLGAPERLLLSIDSLEDLAKIGGTPPEAPDAGRR